MIHSAVRGMCYQERMASDTTQYTHTERHTMTSLKSICFNNTKYTSVTNYNAVIPLLCAVQTGHLIKLENK